MTEEDTHLDKDVVGIMSYAEDKLLRTELSVFRHDITVRLCAQHQWYRNYSAYLDSMSVVDMTDLEAEIYFGESIK